MPWWCVHNSLLQLLVIFLFCLNESFSTNDYPNHQILQVDVGQDIIMSCIFDEDKIEQVSFMRQMTGDILSLGSELFLHQSDIDLTRFASNRLDLKLLSVNQNDSGLYTCMWNDERLVSFLIEVLVPPRFVSYSPMEGNVLYAENSSMNLSCQAFAIPMVNITWIYRSKNKQSRHIHHGNDLYIPFVQPSDSGLYECIASNMHHASISRAFYVTVQYSPRVLILNEKLKNSLRDTVLIRCRVCSIPQVEHISWFKHEQPLLDVNMNIKTQILNDQCTESLMEILDIKDYQFSRYECRGENILGQKSDFIHIRQISKGRKLKPKVSIDEVNRNGRTAVLFNKSAKKKKNQTITGINHSSIAKNFSCWWLLTLLIYWIPSL